MEDYLEHTPEIHVHEVEMEKVRMPQQKDITALTELFKAYSDPSRLKIITALSQAELCVYDICKLLGLEQSAVSHKLRYLKKLHIVKYCRVGKTVVYSLDDSHVTQILKMGLEHVRHENAE